MNATSLGELQSMLIGATRCVNLCPEHVDARAAMRSIIARTGVWQSAWAQCADAATASAMRGIEASFESIA